MIKKCYGRANLYVDEGVSGWNNTHPWISGHNWYVSAEDGADVDGGQIDIKEWTHFLGVNQTVTNSVAYGWGSNDDVADFNIDMVNQSNQIADRRELHQTDDDENTNYHLQNWDSQNHPTLAPEGDWDNSVGAMSSDRTSAENRTLNFQYYKYNSFDFCVPGLSTYLAMYENIQLDGFLNLQAINYNHMNYYPSTNPGHHIITAGLDCSGFIERAADYNGSGYIITGGNETKHKVSTGSFYSDKYSWEIAPNGGQLELLSRLIPGDVIVNFGDHIVIVQDITYLNGTRNIEDLLLSIKVIHAT